MASALPTTALLLSLNLLFFTMVSSTYVPCPPPPPKKPHHKSPPAVPTPAVPTPHVPTPHVPTPAVPTPHVPTPAVPTPAVPVPAPSKATCPRDTLKLGVCANLLTGLVNVVVGGTDKTPCCSIIEGLVDLEAAVCLCTAIKANVLGINLNVPVSLSLLLNACGKKVPSGYQCA